jgi:hypothetical protein
MNIIITKTKGLLTIALIGGLFAFSSCNPKISQSLSKQYPSLPPETPVAVYKDTTEIPSNSTLLGYIDAEDSGFTAICDSATMINLIKENAQKAGGNGILITKHRKPSFFSSSCHRFNTTIYHVPTEAVALTNTYITDTRITKQSPKLPQWVLGADAGWGWRTNKLASGLDPDQRRAMKELMKGWTFHIFSDFYFHKWWGVRLVFQQYNAKTDLAYRTNFGENITDQKDRISFFGPAFMFRFNTNNAKWFFNTGLGVGYAGYKAKLKWNRYNDGEYRGNTVGSYWTVGAEYKFSKHFGVGTNLTLIGASFSEMKVVSNGQKQTVDLDGTEGISTANIMFGLRYYIK